MKIGIPKEIKNEEYRVGLTPMSAREVIDHGHEVFVETNAGQGIGFTDEMYAGVGAQVLPSAKAVFEITEMIVKVKEPQKSEYALLKKDQILFTYLHLAPDPDQAKGLIDSGCVAIAYETVTGDLQALPLLTPMSQVAGRLSIQAGARSLEKPVGGSGVLLGGVPGVYPGKVVVVGGGVVGTNAVRMAMGKEAMVTVLDNSLKRLQELDFQFGSRLNTIFSTSSSLHEYVVDADLVIGAVLLAGQAAPTLITREMIHQMRPGSVVVDVAIDQGGCMETSKATTHSNPTYVVDGVVHYCVANMPGAVPRTSTMALNNATLPFVLKLADHGYQKALQEDSHLRMGLNVCQGHITHEGVANDLGMPYTSPENFIR